MNAMEESGDPTQGREVLDEVTARRERVLLGLRLDEGIPDGGFAPEVIEALSGEGWILREAGRLRLSEKGILLFNEVILRLEQARENR